MGVVLTPIITKDTIALDALRGKTLAVDGNGELYQFLALIRLRDGTPLQDSKGRTTSHLSGLFYRTTRLMAEHALQAGVRVRRRAAAAQGAGDREAPRRQSSDTKTSAPLRWRAATSRRPTRRRR